jgi:peptidyl-dipeptidase Dcp
MRKRVIFGVICFAGLGLALVSCAKKENPSPPAAATAPAEANPFLAAYGTPFETPPFDRIRDAHFMPTFLEGMALQKKEIEAVVANPEPPTFANTIEAVERSGELLTRVVNVFFSLSEANTNEALQKIEAEISPLLAKHQDDINLDPKLFARVKTVYDGRDKLVLTAEQVRLLDKFYKNFVRGGANLDEAAKAEFRKINEELSLLSVKFGDNVLKETNAFALVIDKADDLAGLPQAVIDGAAEAAKERGMEGRWVFTLHKPSMIPFLQYSPKRDLREKIFKAYINRANNGDASDNKAVLSRVAALRMKRASLLGYKTHADFVLEENMAKTPAGVTRLLDQLWTPALAMAGKEAGKLQGLAMKEGGMFKLEPWDWWYYAEKLKKAEYDLDDQALKPYFRLDNVRDGAFAVAGKLWGLQFTERTDIPKYHPDVRVFEIKEADGTHVGILYTDYFPRASKRGGAWSGAFRSQSARDGKKITPVVYNVGNFSMPAGDTPSLLTFEEVATLFHEFGHGLHELLSDCTYETVSGTNVPSDFVEVASQIMENWAGDPEVIKTYANHYRTSEPIPDALVEKIKNAGLFNKGFETVEYLAACYLDMDWHTLTEPKEQDAAAFETASMARIGLIPEIVVRYRSPYFSHIFSGGYSSGYYSYIWSEVLDADAFEAFKETSLFDQATAKSLRDNILSRGGTEDPMALYKKFRGREPKVEPLLKRKGFLK